MKYGKLLQLLLEELPPEYRDKFLSYKQLKKRIKSFLASNSLPDAAFEPDVVVAVNGAAEARIAREEVEEEEGRPSVEVTTTRDVKVRWPDVKAEDHEGPPAGKKAKGSDGEAFVVVRCADAAAVAERGKGEEEKEVAEEDDDEGALVAAVVAGTKRKGVASVVDEGIVAAAAAPIEREILAVGGRGPQRVGEEKELTSEEEEFLRLLNVELEKFNSFFTEKEEDYVIRLQVNQSTSHTWGWMDGSHYRSCSLLPSVKFLLVSKPQVAGFVRVGGGYRVHVCCRRM